MSVTTDPASCRSCGEALPRGARFCPACGSSAAAPVSAAAPAPADSPTATMQKLPQTPSEETLELRAERPVTAGPVLHEARRRPLDLDPPTLLGGAGALCLLAAVVLFATGAWIVGIVVLGLAVGVLTLFVGAIRRHPDHAASRAVLLLAARLGGWAQFILVAASAGSRAAVTLLELRRRRHRLERERRSRLGPLGEAVVRGEAEREAALKAEVASLEQALERTAQEARDVAASTRRRLEDERRTIQPTQTLRAPQADGP